MSWTVYFAQISCHLLGHIPGLMCHVNTEFESLVIWSQYIFFSANEHNVYAFLFIYIYNFQYVLQLAFRIIYFIYIFCVHV